MTRLGGNPHALPKRFYKHASLADGRTVLLDGKPAKTAARRELAAGSRALAEAIVQEWNAQRDVIDFNIMPMTRFQMTVLDRSDADADLWRGAILAFLRSDLLCYRAEAPAELVARQAALWDPLLAWAASEGISLKTGAGVGYIAQSEVALRRCDDLLSAAGAPSLLAMKTAAEIAGSAVIALAMGRGAFHPEELFESSRVDETFQAEKWGWDAEAEARTRLMKRDFLDAWRYLTLSASASTAG
jgi:chaperone required for assembly of F1-ATPase